MSGTYRYNRTSSRAARRDRHKPYQPSNTGKPSRSGGAGTRSGK